MREMAMQEAEARIMRFAALDPPVRSNPGEVRAALAYEQSAIESAEREAVRRKEMGHATEVNIPWSSILIERKKA
jgi:hypothetical protein